MGCKLNTKTDDQIKLEQLIRAKCEENTFVRSKNSYYAQDDPFVDTNTKDYGLRFSYFNDIQKLKHAFANYSGLRSVYIYKDLVFVNALIDGWEAWTLKRFGDKLIAIDTISIRIVIKYNTEENKQKMTFEEYVEYLNNMTETQITFYMQKELSPKELADLPEEVTTKKTQ